MRCEPVAAGFQLPARVSARAKEMSGCRCFGSSDGSTLNTSCQPHKPVMAMTSSATLHADLIGIAEIDTEEVVLGQRA